MAYFTNGADIYSTYESEASRVVPNSTSESTVPKISKGQLTDTVPIQSLPFPQYPTNMIWSIPSSRNSLSSFNEYSYHITGNTSQPMMAQKNVDSPMPPTNNPEDLSAVVVVVANNKMKQVGSTQPQVQSTNTLPGLSSESILRMLSKEADFFNLECSEIHKQVDRFCQMLCFVAFTESTTRYDEYMEIISKLSIQIKDLHAPAYGVLEELKKMMVKGIRVYLSLYSMFSFSPHCVHSANSIPTLTCHNQLAKCLDEAEKVWSGMVGTMLVDRGINSVCVEIGDREFWSGRIAGLFVEIPESSIDAVEEEDLEKPQEGETDAQRSWHSFKLGCILEEAIRDIDGIHKELSKVKMQGIGIGRKTTTSTTRAAPIEKKQSPTALNLVAANPATAVSPPSIGYDGLAAGGAAIKELGLLMILMGLVEMLEGKEIELESKLKELDVRTGNLETLMSKMEEVRQAALKLHNLDPERPAQADPLLNSTARQIGSQPEPPPAKPNKSEGPAKLPEK
nr:putative disease resistance RPP13-like protein 3 isoform X2 [Ipomoea trifida]